MKGFNALKLFIAGTALLSVQMYSTLGFSAVDSEVTVEGIVLSFDEKIVEIFNRGTTTKVPRDSAPKVLKKGDQVQVSFDLEKFKETLNK